MTFEMRQEDCKSQMEGKSGSNCCMRPDNECMVEKHEFEDLVVMLRHA